MDTNGSFFSYENRQTMEQSFKEFASRPENKPVLEQHQKEEVAAAVQLQERAQQLALEKEVSRLDPADVKLLAPVMASPILRQLLISLNNDSNDTTATTTTSTSSSSNNSSGGLKSWVSNPRVVQLLRQAAKALRQGKLTPKHLAGLLQQQHKAMQSESAAAAEPLVAPHQAKLLSHMLVEALNEHLAERYAGNKAYKQQDYTTAMHHYERALAVVDFVVGSTPDDQAEVQRNKATVLLNMAAVHMALQEWGAAVRCCDEGLQIPQPADEAVKAWLRRSKANLGRHEYGAALQDLDRAEELDPWNEDISTGRATVLMARKQAMATTDWLLAANMFKRPPT